MHVVLPLEQMTTEEKLQVMEALWTDLSRRDDRYDSPNWHAEVLRDRDQRIADGKEASLDWEEAKRKLRREQS